MDDKTLLARSIVLFGKTPTGLEKLNVLQIPHDSPRDVVHKKASQILTDFLSK